MKSLSTERRRLEIAAKVYEHFTHSLDEVLAAYSPKDSPEEHKLASHIAKMLDNTLLSISRATPPPHLFPQQEQPRRPLEELGPQLPQGPQQPRQLQLLPTPHDRPYATRTRPEPRSPRTSGSLPVSRRTPLCGNILPSHLSMPYEGIWALTAPGLSRRYRRSPLA